VYDVMITVSVKVEADQDLSLVTEVTFLTVHVNIHANTAPLHSAPSLTLSRPAETDMQHAFNDINTDTRLPAPQRLFDLS